jgi:hypothetical protein
MAIAIVNLAGGITPKGKIPTLATRRKTTSRSVLLFLLMLLIFSCAHTQQRFWPELGQAGYLVN